MAALLDNYQQSFVALLLKTQLHAGAASRCSSLIVFRWNRKNRIASRIGDNPVFVCVLSG